MFDGLVLRCELNIYTWSVKSQSLSAKDGTICREFLQKAFSHRGGGIETKNKTKNI